MEHTARSGPSQARPASIAARSDPGRAVCFIADDQIHLKYHLPVLMIHKLSKNIENILIFRLHHFVLSFFQNFQKDISCRKKVILNAYIYL